MQRKITILFIMLGLLCAVLLCSCSMEETQTDAVITAGQNVVGGDESLGSGINLKDMAIEKQGDETVITLGFLSGSRNSEMSEQKISSVPNYNISMLEAPCRLQVDLNVDYLDYASENEVFEDSLILGTFRTVYSASNHISLYFQLSSYAEAKVEEAEDKLIIRLTERTTDIYERYYVGLNAYEEYSQNLISFELNLSPTFCEGLSERMLISQPFVNEGDAQALLLAVGEAIKNEVPNKQPYVFTMSTDMLPVCNVEVEEETVTEKSVMMSNGAPSTLPVLVENGRYLCTKPDGTIIYARSYIPNVEEDEEQVVKEKLWQIESADKKTEIPLPDFYSIEKAEVSADGRYLAILDSGLESKVLYVLDMDENTLINLGEEGFGDHTASFVWNKDRPAIYAMTGYGGALQLTEYDFNKEGYERISSVEEKNGADSKIAMHENKIYFADRAAGEMGQGEIYAVDIETSERTFIGNGIDFSLAPNGAYLIALQAEVEDEANFVFSFVLLDLNEEGEAGGASADPEGEAAAQEDNAQTVGDDPAGDDEGQDEEVGQGTGENMDGSLIAAAILPENENYAFDSGSDVFYFTTRTYEGTTEEYPVALVKYTVSTGTSEVIGYLTTGTFVPGVQAGELYIIDSYLQDYNNYYITYIYGRN